MDAEGSHTRVKKILEPLARMFQYGIRESEDYLSFVDANSRIVPRFATIADQDVFAYFSVRTSSWDFDGERTDIHDALSMFVATTLRAFDVSCELWDVPNPVMDIPTELYGRYITIAQPTRSTYRLDENGIKALTALLFGVRWFESNLRHLFDWHPNIDRMGADSYGWQDEQTKGWARTVARGIGETLRSRTIQYNFRKNPSWLYYRSAAKSIAVYASPLLAMRMRAFIESAACVRTTEAVTGTAYCTGSSRNLVPYIAARPLQALLAHIEPRAAKPPLLFPIDSHVLAVGSEHLVSLRYDCGLKLFDEERERVRARRRTEEELFFPNTTFAWSATLDDGRFELLIRDLLSVEPGVRWVRKVGQTREGDEGRDLMCEWITPVSSSEPVEDEKPPFATRRVVVQCKATARSVGKAMVQDVYDTVRRHGADGYFLAVSSQLSVPLTRFLEGLRHGRNIWADWWTRSEIEDRLRDRPEVLARYPDLVRVDTL